MLSSALKDSVAAREFKISCVSLSLFLASDYRNVQLNFTPKTDLLHVCIITGKEKRRNSKRVKTNTWYPISFVSVLKHLEFVAGCAS